MTNRLPVEVALCNLPQSPERDLLTAELHALWRLDDQRTELQAACIQLIAALDIHDRLGIAANTKAHEALLVIQDIIGKE